MSRHRHRRGAFTLVELVAWLALLTLGLGAVLALRLASAREARAAEVRRDAERVADDLLEELAGVRAAGLPALAGPRPPVEVSGIVFRPTVVVAPVAGSPTLLRVRVTVGWEPEKQTFLETLRTTREAP